MRCCLGCWVKLLSEFYCFITHITSTGSRKFEVLHLPVGLLVNKSFYGNRQQDYFKKNVIGSGTLRLVSSGVYFLLMLMLAPV